MAATRKSSFYWAVYNFLNRIRELYHGKCWKADPRFRAPMVSLPNGTPVFTRDIVMFYHPYLGFTKGLVTEFCKPV